MMNIIAWSASAPWAEIGQVQQDLIISRALIELFGEQRIIAHCKFLDTLSARLCTPAICLQHAPFWNELRSTTHPAAGVFFGLLEKRRHGLSSPTRISPASTTR